MVWIHRLDTSYNSESWFTSCTLDVTPNIMRRFNTKLRGLEL